jgi:hypothetical protein
VRASYDSEVGGGKSIVRGLFAAVTIAALVAAVWLGVLGHQEADRAAELRDANATAVAHNHALNSKVQSLNATNTRTQARVTSIDAAPQATTASAYALVQAWNDWSVATNALIVASNRFVNEPHPSSSAVHADLDRLMRTVNEKEAAYQAALVKFSAEAEKARRAIGETKP